MKKSILIFLLFFCSICFGCEFGKTYKDFSLDEKSSGKPDSYDLSVASDGGAYYFPNGDITKDFNGIIWERIFFDKNGIIEKYTDYTWCGYDFHRNNPPPKGRCPYIVYKGHRWYPQYHGIIYVYEDGREIE